jgi:hypothetical protein
MLPLDTIAAMSGTVVVVNPSPILIEDFRELEIKAHERVYFIFYCIIFITIS